MKRIKYWLLRKLLADICGKTECCKSCEMRVNYGDIRCCVQSDIHEQARKVWGIDK